MDSPPSATRRSRRDRASDRILRTSANFGPASPVVSGLVSRVPRRHGYIAPEPVGAWPGPAVWKECHAPPGQVQPAW
eukprot:1205111-Rhodomonas_salina.1